MRKLKLEELNRLSLSDYKESDKLPVVVVLDNLRSALNIGSIFRTVDGLGLASIVLCGISAQPPHKEINKTAIGATKSVDWTYKRDIVRAIEELKDNGYKVLGIEQTDMSTSLDNYKFKSEEKIAIVVGNEVEGLSSHVLPLIDAAIELPQYGTKHSFNVAVCTGMVLWEISKQVRSKQ